MVPLLLSEPVHRHLQVRNRGRPFTHVPYDISFPLRDRAVIEELHDPEALTKERGVEGMVAQAFGSEPGAHGDVAVHVAIEEGVGFTPLGRSNAFLRHGCR